MKLFLSKFSNPLLLIAIGSCWILLLNYILQINSQTFMYPDSVTYLRASENLYWFHKTHSIRPSLIAAINGFPLLFGFSKAALFGWNTVVNLVSWFAIVILLYQMVLRLASKRIAFLLALLYVFTLGSMILIFQILSETVFALVLLLVLYLIQKYLERKNIKYLAIGLSILLLSILIKPVSKGLTILVMVVFIYSMKQLIRSRWSLLVYVSVFTLLFHMYDMKKNYGDFTISYIDTFTYYNYLGTHADCLKNNTEFLQCQNPRYDYFAALPFPESKKVALEDFKYQALNNTGNFAKAYFINLFYNSYRGNGYFYEFRNIDNSPSFEMEKTFFRGISKLQNIFYTLIGLCLSVYFLLKNKRKLHITTMPSLFILYIFLVSGVSSDQGDRFHLVFYPFVILLMAKFIADKGRAKLV